MQNEDFLWADTRSNNFHAFHPGNIRLDKVGLPSILWNTIFGGIENHYL
jgi:hypothetical protein